MPDLVRPSEHAGLRSIAPHYGVLFIDLWGVIHDGTRPFPGAVHALQALAEAERTVVFLTNSSRTGPQVSEMLDGMGIGRELYTALVSSGDVTREALVARDARLFSRLPERPHCLHVGDPNYVPWLFELGLDFIDDLQDAELVLATAGAGDDAELERVRQRLTPAAARGIPMVCTNPDKVVPTARGLTLGPGAVAQAYAELGGPVFLYGKPHPPIYAAARAACSSSGASRTVAIGDSLDTDIRGARKAGIDSVLIARTGVHANELRNPTSGLDPLFTAAGVAPDMLIDRFIW